MNNSTTVKQKRFFKTTRKMKEDKEIPYCHYCDKKYHSEDFFWNKLQDLSLKYQSTRNK